jgi:hypothetical protein
VLASADGSHRRVLAPGEAPRFSADGRWVLFAAPRKGNNLFQQVSLYGGVGSRAQPIERYELSTGKVSALGINGNPYSVSPDLTQLADTYLNFSGRSGPQGKLYMRIIPTAKEPNPDPYVPGPLETTFPLPLQEYEGTAVLWLRNGWLTWSCVNRNGSGLCVINARTRAWRDFQMPMGIPRQLALSPSGRYAVEAGNGCAYTINTATGRPIHLLTCDPHPSNQPDFPDWRPVP